MTKTRLQVRPFDAAHYLNSEEEIADGKAPLNDRKLNNPDTAGIVYMTVQGIPASRRDEVAAFLAPIREARLRRTAAISSGWPAASWSAVGMGPL